MIPDPKELQQLADDGCPHHVDDDPGLTPELLDLLSQAGEFGGFSRPKSKSVQFEHEGVVPVRREV